MELEISPENTRYLKARINDQVVDISDHEPNTSGKGSNTGIILQMGLNTTENAVKNLWWDNIRMVIE